jgi:hypothetical protein
MFADGAGIPVARCGICKREVLTHIRLDATGALCRCCVACDALFDPGDVRWVAEEAFAGGGAVRGALGNEGCGSGGCGAGTCGRR